MADDTEAPSHTAVTTPAAADDIATGKISPAMLPARDLDVAAAYADRLAGDDAYTPREAQRLRWKIDLRLVPILWLNVSLGAMDKVATSTAALYGMRADTGLVGDQYAWVGSVFYFGYLIWCLPSGSLLQRFPVAKTMAVVQLLWGLVLVGTGFARNFGTLIALRILLGALEAPIVPGNFLILGMWYSRREQPIRAGLMYTGLATCLTGPIGYGVGFIAWEEKWRWFFWITGIITCVWSVLVFLFLPDNPVTAKFLDEREKAIAVDRVRADQTGIENKMFKREQVVEAFLDPKTWLMFLFNLWVNVPNGGLTNFSPLIVNGLGFSAQRSTLLTIPNGVIQTASSYMCNGAVFILATKYPTVQARGVVIILGLIVGCIASVFLYTLPTDDYWGRLGAMWVSFFYLGPYIVSLGLNTANTAGHTKKVTVNALIFIAYCVSNVIGPQFFKSDQAPLYPLGIGAMWAAYALAIVTMLMYMAYCYYENRRRDRVDKTAGQRVHEDTDFKDLTDRENVHFRYVW